MGSDKPEADAETVLVTNNLMKAAGLQNYSFKIGHIGILRGLLNQKGIDDRTQNAILQLMDKKEYNKALELVADEELRIGLESLWELKGKTTFDTLDLIEEIVDGCDEAEAANENLRNILCFVSECECLVEKVDPAFARGLEYYTGMIFEVNVPELDVALGGGGRYDRLVEVFGGKPTPAVGVAHGLDRIALAMQTQKVAISTEQGIKIMVIPVQETMRGYAVKIANKLRKARVMTELEVMGRKMRKALEDADKRKMDYAVIVGENEMNESSVVLRDLAKHEQTKVKITELLKKIKEQNKKKIEPGKRASDF
jgi:histidyl-tRNA synthetase